MAEEAGWLERFLKTFCYGSSLCHFDACHYVSFFRVVLTTLLQDTLKRSNVRFSFTSFLTRSFEEFSSLPHYARALFDLVNLCKICCSLNVTFDKKTCHIRFCLCCACRCKEVVHVQRNLTQSMLFRVIKNGSQM